MQLALPSLFIEAMYICILSSPLNVLNFQALSSLLLITTRSEYLIVLVLSNSCQHFYEQVFNLVYVIHCLFFFFSTIGSFTRFLLLILAFLLFSLPSFYIILPYDGRLLKISIYSSVYIL